MLAVVVAAVVVCAALMTMLLMALLRNGQEEAQKPEPAVTATAKPPTPTKRHEKKPTENGENGEAGTSVELPTESEKSTQTSAGESVNPEENPLPESLEEILLGAEGGCHDYNSYNPYDSYDFYNDRNAYGQ